MHEVFQEYYHQDPQNHVSHIPSVIVTPSASNITQYNLCYASRYLPEQSRGISETDIHATAVALLEAAQQLEADSDARQIQAANQDAGGSSAVRKYFLKRNYSGE